MQILITTEKGVQSIYDTDTGRIGQAIKFMKDWNMADMEEYCKRKGWKIEIINPSPPVPYEYYVAGDE